MQRILIQSLLVIAKNLKLALKYINNSANTRPIKVTTVAFIAPTLSVNLPPYRFPKNIPNPAKNNMYGIVEFESCVTFIINGDI